MKDNKTWLEAIQEYKEAISGDLFLLLEELDDVPNPVKIVILELLIRDFSIPELTNLILQLKEEEESFSESRVMVIKVKRVNIFPFVN